MKTDITYLPSHKQAELQQIVTIIREAVPAEMIILFGSYSRNTFVEDWYDEKHFRYLSDFDLLVIVENKSEAIQSKFTHEIKKKITKNENIKTPISVIVHDIEFVNRRLQKAQYFFADIKKEGVLLYDSCKYQLNEPRELHPSERKKIAQEYFDFYFKKAEEFKYLFNVSLNKEMLSNSAFLLHQTTERLYAGILLVFTNYKPNTHNLEVLRQLTNSLDNRFIQVFPLENDEQERLFELLKDAYVDARYNRNYKITKEELLTLASQVEHLKELGAELCKEKINSFSEK